MDICGVQSLYSVQYLDLIYNQSGTLYEKILNAPRPKFSIPPPPKSNKDSHTGNNMIGTTSMKSTKATSRKACKISDQNENEEILTSEVNAMSTDKGKEPKQPGGKKKEKSKKKKQDDSSPEKPSANPSGQKKPTQPCLICDEDHWMRDCPYKAEVKKFFKNSKTSAVLTDPFPNP